MAGGFEKVIATYEQAFAVHGDSPNAVLWPKGRQALRFDALTTAMGGKGFAVLDYGCGLAHLKPYLDERFEQVRYHGVDLVKTFIENDRQKYPNARFECIASHEEVLEDYDHVVLSGVFNMLLRSDRDTHWALVRAVLEHLFAHTRVALAVNFMTDAVDFQQEGAYHQNVAELLAFANTHLSPRLRLDQSYMPYEYTLTVYRDRTIVRPDNIYGGAA